MFHFGTEHYCYEETEKQPVPQKTEEVAFLGENFRLIYIPILNVCICIKIDYIPVIFGLIDLKTKMHL